MESGIKAWVLLFSQFTPEALFFESLAILVLGAAYSAYWVIRKRRLGPDGQTVSTGVVKSYLNQLIGDAELLRTQLFGLLAETGGITARSVLAEPSASAGAGGPQIIAGTGPSVASQVSDPQLALKIAELERKLLEQTGATNQILAQKTKLEQELAAAKAKGGAAPAGGDPKEAEALRNKVKELEGRLAEYSVIEDDLANLKRLQQENAQLRSQIGGGAVAVAAAAAAASAAAPAPAPAAKAAPSPAAEPAAEPVAPKAASAHEAEFEGLVDEVEKSLETAAAEPAAPIPSPEPAAGPADDLAALADQTVAAAEGTPASGTEPGAEPGADASPIDSIAKGDEDLLAEFEKMLNS